MSRTPTSSVTTIVTAADVRAWMEPKQVAARIKRSTKTVIAMVDDGRLRGIVVGGGRKRRRIRIDPASVN
jgi:hypothetical protein